MIACHGRTSWEYRDTSTCRSPTGTRRWNGGSAEKRVRKWADAQDEPNAKYRRAHLWYDDDAPDNFTSYKLLFADVVDGKLVAVPRGIMRPAR